MFQLLPRDSCCAPCRYRDRRITRSQCKHGPGLRFLLGLGLRPCRPPGMVCPSLMEVTRSHNAACRSAFRSKIPRGSAVRRLPCGVRSLRIPNRPRTEVTVLRSKRSRPSVRSLSAQGGIHDGLPNVAPGDILFFRGDNLILDRAKHFGMRLGPVGPPAGSILGDGHRKI